MVRRYSRRLRARLAQLTREQRAISGSKNHLQASRIQVAAWWLLKQTEDLNPERLTFVELPAVPFMSRSERDTGDGAGISEGRRRAAG